VGYALSQTSGVASHPATAVASSSDASSTEAAPTPAGKAGKGKGKGKAGKAGQAGKAGKGKGKGGKAQAAPTPASGSSESSSSMESSEQSGPPNSLPGLTSTDGSTTVGVVTDTSCTNAGVGALWCASKKKCLKAWEEACPDFASEESSPVTVQTKSAVASAPVAIGQPPSVADNTGAAPPVVYQPAAPANPLYPPAGSTVIYPAGSLSGVATVTPPVIYQPATGGVATIYPVGGSVVLGAPGAPIGGSVVITSPPVAPLGGSVVFTGPPRSVGLIGGQTDNGGCLVGAGYSFCAALGRCVRPWETPCPSS